MELEGYRRWVLGLSLILEKKIRGIYRPFLLLIHVEIWMINPKGRVWTVVFECESRMWGHGLLKVRATGIFVVMITLPLVHRIFEIKKLKMQFYSIKLHLWARRTNQLGDDSPICTSRAYHLWSRKSVWSPESFGVVLRALEAIRGKIRVSL